MLLCVTGPGPYTGQEVAGALEMSSWVQLPADARAAAALVDGAEVSQRTLDRSRLLRAADSITPTASREEGKSA